MKKVIKILDYKIFTYHDSRVHSNATLMKIHTGFFFLPYPWKQKMSYYIDIMMDSVYKLI